MSDSPDSARIDAAFPATLVVLKNALALLESQIDEPVAVPFRDSQVFRYREKGIQQAVIQKFARVVSGLQSAALLLREGMGQEAAVICMTLDEFGEDVAFLCAAANAREVSTMHQRFLESFYAEGVDFATGDPLPAKPGQGLTRSNLRAFVAGNVARGLSPAQLAQGGGPEGVASSVGAPHNVSARIMEMYQPGRGFRVGETDPALMAGYERTLWTYFLRGLVTATMAANLFADRSVTDALVAYTDKFAGQDPQ